jgi:hypothetical protein
VKKPQLALIYQKIVDLGGFESVYDACADCISGKTSLNHTCMINRTTWTSAVDTFYEDVSNVLTDATILHIVELAAQNFNVCPVGAQSYIIQDSTDKVFVDSQAGVHSARCVCFVWGCG